MITRRAECACGQLAAICVGEPVRVSICHCLACKRRTGSAFSHNARFAIDAVAIEGRTKEYVRIADSGGRATFSFCPDCGATVLYRLDADPELIAIPAGAFADPRFPKPFLAFYDGRRCDWVEIRAEPLETFG